MRSLAFTVSILLGLGGCETGDPVGARASGIIGGRPSGANHDAVIQVTPGAGSCTASLLASNLVVTARHCVAKLPSVQYACTVSGGVTSPVDAGAGRVGALIDPQEFVVGALYADAPRGANILVSTDTSRCQTDIALVVLDRGIDDPVITPIRLASPPTQGEALISGRMGLYAEAPRSYPAVRQERDVTVDRNRSHGGGQQLPCHRAQLLCCR